MSVRLGASSSEPMAMISAVSMNDVITTEDTEEEIIKDGIEQMEFGVLVDSSPSRLYSTFVKNNNAETILLHRSVAR